MESIFEILGRMIPYIATNYIVFAFMDMIYKKKLERQVLLLEQQNQINYNYYQNLERQYERSRQIMHDINKHINVLEKLNQTSKEYSDELIKLIGNLGYKFKCTDKVLNVIINEKIMLCYLKKIKFNLQIEDIDFSFINKVDRTVIFMNLLDNAIEECEEIINNKRDIEMKMKTVHHHIVGEISNACRYNEIIVNIEGCSTKEGHIGLGLINVKTTIERYGGHIIYDVFNHRFVVKFMIPLVN
ncbi:GHKL domain-containing protein [Clostridium botulinum]|uniref:GHKL domain-containing protein n=1 Tax=Clostridium botulinum TaxID=1491 RepID=UPI0024921DFD|nr:GHKL domain-containing protein [Clostridium botulinum]BDB03000.1 hypothetical protein CBOS2020_30740 [Clostridium botulinum]